LTKADIDQMKSKFQKIMISFQYYKKELEKLLPKLNNISSYNAYTATLKPEVDKFLFLLANLEIDCAKIEEDKIIKKHLKNEYNAMQFARQDAAKVRNQVESKIPKYN
jgi:hypothetical protein